jgi:hypothetical protein
MSERDNLEGFFPREFEREIFALSLEDIDLNQAGSSL